MAGTIEKLYFRQNCPFSWISWQQKLPIPLSWKVLNLWSWCSFQTVFERKCWLLTIRKIEVWDGKNCKICNLQTTLKNFLSSILWLPTNFSTLNNDRIFATSCENCRKALSFIQASVMGLTQEMKLFAMLSNVLLFIWEKLYVNKNLWLSVVCGIRRCGI